MRVLTPTTLDDALAMLAAEGQFLTPIAGGTDLLVSWHHQPKDDLSLLDLTPLREQLQPLRLTDDFLELGGLTTYWDVLASPEVSAAFPLLAEAACEVGAIQILINEGTNQDRPGMKVNYCLVLKPWIKLD